jgi:hypothetical protein
VEKMILNNPEISQDMKKTFRRQILPENAQGYRNFTERIRISLIIENILSVIKLIIIIVNTKFKLKKGRGLILRYIMNLSIFLRLANLVWFT